VRTLSNTQRLEHLGGTSIIAFVQDPTGYKFEVIQRKQRDPLCQVMLRVKDLDKTIA